METGERGLGRARRRGVCKIALVQLLVRAVWIAPVFLPVSVPVRILFGVAFGIFAVLPMRFRAACQMRRVNGCPSVVPAPYFRRVVGGATRFLLGAVWGVPLVGMLWLIHRYIFVLDATRYARDAALLGSYLAADAGEARQQTIGLFLVGFAFLISLLLFLYGWRRHILYEFLLTGGAQPVSALAASRRAKKSCRAGMIKIVGVNLLTLLPALTLPLAFFCWKCGGVQNMLMSLFLLIGNGLVMDPASLWITLALFLCLYLPFIPYRKGRYAALVNAYER